MTDSNGGIPEHCQAGAVVGASRACMHRDLLPVAVPPQCGPHSCCDGDDELAIGSAGTAYVVYSHERGAFGIWSWDEIPDSAAARSGTLHGVRRDCDSGAELPFSKADIFTWGRAEKDAAAAPSDTSFAADWQRHLVQLKVCP